MKQPSRSTAPSQEAGELPKPSTVAEKLAASVLPLAREHNDVPALRARIARLEAELENRAHEDAPENLTVEDLIHAPHGSDLRAVVVGMGAEDSSPLDFLADIARDIEAETWVMVALAESGRTDEEDYQRFVFATNRRAGALRLLLENEAHRFRAARLAARAVAS
jgi:hypothetical protein